MYGKYIYVPMYVWICLSLAIIITTTIEIPKRKQFVFSRKRVFYKNEGESNNKFISRTYLHKIVVIHSNTHLLIHTFKLSPKYVFN